MDRSPLRRLHTWLALTLLVATVVITSPTAVVAVTETTSPNCGPITVTSPRALRVKTYVAGCWWDEEDLGHSVIVSVRITGPKGFSKLLTKYQYGIPIGGPLAAQAVYGGKPALKVPRKGRYTITLREYYPYRLVPAVAVKKASVYVSGGG
jgi:hypothetical protein